jgi:endonuclease/exonuclease/phosphatase family metal-dependent hydrolase
VGLQEVSLWRDQAPGDALTHPDPDATHVRFDYLAILLSDLRARGVPYEPATTSTGADLEFPYVGPSGGLDDLRLTDRDAILVRSDVAGRVSDPRHRDYTAQLSEPFVTGPVESTRSWSSIDYRADPRTTVRIFNTHLEVADPGTGSIQQEQAGELLAQISASPHPVIAIGDFNAPARGSPTPTYRKLAAALHDTWSSARPADPGWTCCRSSSLADRAGHEQIRIDYVFASGNWPVAQVARVDDRPFRTSPPPLWVSDHDGVLARLVLDRQ